MGVKAKDDPQLETLYASGSYSKVYRSNKLLHHIYKLIKLSLSEFKAWLRTVPHLINMNMIMQSPTQDTMPNKINTEST